MRSRPSSAPAGSGRSGWYTGRVSERPRAGSSSRRAASSTTPTRTPTSFPTGSRSPGTDHLVIPYTLDANDFKFLLPNGFVTADDFHDYLVDSFDRLYEEGGRMMSVGLHCRIVGRPGRAAALDRFLEHVQAQGRRVGDDPRRDRPALASSTTCPARARCGSRSSARGRWARSTPACSATPATRSGRSTRGRSTSPRSASTGSASRARAATGSCRMSATIRPGRGRRRRPGRHRDEGDARARRRRLGAVARSAPTPSCSRSRTGSARARSWPRCSATSASSLGVAGGFGASLVAPGHVHHHGFELVRLGERHGPVIRADRAGRRRLARRRLHGRDRRRRRPSRLGEADLQRVLQRHVHRARADDRRGDGRAARVVVATACARRGLRGGAGERRSRSASTTPCSTSPTSASGSRTRAPRCCSTGSRAAERDRRHQRRHPAARRGTRPHGSRATRR